MDFQQAVAWLRNASVTDHTDIAPAQELLELFDREPARGDHTLWHQQTGTSKPWGVARRSKNATSGKFNNRPLADIKKDLQSALVRYVEAKQQSSAQQVPEKRSAGEEAPVPTTKKKPEWKQPAVSGPSRLC